MKKRVLAIITAISICAMSGCKTAAEPPKADQTPGGASPDITDNIAENDPGTIPENKPENVPQDPGSPDPMPEKPAENKTPEGTSPNDPEKLPEKDPETVPQKPQQSDKTPNSTSTKIPEKIPEPVPQKPAVPEKTEYDNSGLYPEISKEELKAAIDAFPLDEITLPDGSKVSKDQAVYGNTIAETLTFPFAFYRIASPIYKTTADDPDLIRYVDGNWEATVDTDALANEIDRTYKKAAPGDVIENGLTVSGAVCAIDSRGNISKGTIYFDGEITLSGALNYSPEERMYKAPDAMSLRPDSVKAKIPILYESKVWVYHYWDGFSNGENDPPFYMYFDSKAFNLGNKSDKEYQKFDFDSVFGDKTTVIATVTVSDIKMDSITGVSCKIVDIK